MSFATIASISAPCAWSDPLQFRVSDDPASSQLLTLYSADQYLGNPNFYDETWDPALMAIGIGENDPDFRNIVDVRRFQNQEQMPGESMRANEAVALDAAPIACPGGFAIRTVDAFGRVRTVRITAVPQPATPGSQGERFVKLIAINNADEDWARQLIHIGQEIGRRHEVSFPLGSGRIRFAAQLNSDRRAALGNESPVDTRIGYTLGQSFTASINPVPLYDNQVVDRIDLAWARPGSSTRFTVRNLAWRRARSYIDSTQVVGDAWVAGMSTAVSHRTSLSTAVSAWNGDGKRGTDTMLTGEYRANANRVYGLGIMASDGSLSPFASYARTLGPYGRLYLSLGAPLDDHTRVPVACRMSMGF